VSTLQEQAAAMLETIDATEGESKYARLTPSDRVLIIRLAQKGTLTQDEIARAVGCHKSTVCRVLQFIDTRPEARVILESGAAKMAETVVNTKDAGVALKALGKLDVVREDASGGVGNTNFIIVVGQPGAGLEPPALDAAGPFSAGDDAA